MTRPPRSSTTRRSVASRAARVGSHSTTSPPCDSTARRLTRGAPAGMTTVAGIERRRAARARAAPWLPEEWVQTPPVPDGASEPAIESTALLAPRNLNAPARCRFSHLKATSAPTSRSISRLVTTGVRRTCGAIRRAAASTSAKPGTSRVVSPAVPSLTTSLR